MNIDFLNAMLKAPEYLELLKYLFFSCLFFQVFIHSYLLKKNAIDRSIPFARYLPAEILGRFRDYTKKNGSHLHILYYIQLILACITFVLFVPIAIADIEFSNPIVRIVLIPISITVGLMIYITFIQLFDKYYK